MKHPWDPHAFVTGAGALHRDPKAIEAGLAIAREIKRRNTDAPVIFTLHHLAHLADVSADAASRYAGRTSPLPYRTFRLKKRGLPNQPRRAYRTISVPEPGLMRLQRWIAQNIISLGVRHLASFAFHKDGGALRAADRHVNSSWLVKMDIRNFFDSIKEHHVYRIFRSFGYTALLCAEMARICTRFAPGIVTTSLSRYRKAPYPGRREGQLPQGAPSSPALANLAAYWLDVELQALADVSGFRYTRYADDMAFSRTDQYDRDQARRFVALVKRELERFGFESNDAKTTISPPGGRRIVLGLQVDGPRPRLSRAFKDNLETHLHALSKPGIGPDNHRRNRGFVSLIGLRRHVSGLIAYAHHIEPDYAAKCYSVFDTLTWPV